MLGNGLTESLSLNYSFRRLLSLLEIVNLKVDNFSKNSDSDNANANVNANANANNNNNNNNNN